MIIKTSQKVIQKFVLLAILLACLGVISAGDGTKARTCAPNSLIPCCSYCDEHPEAPICRHGCSLGCRAIH